MLRDRYYIKDVSTDKLLSSYTNLSNLRWSDDEYGAMYWADRKECGSVCALMISNGLKVTFINRPVYIPDELSVEDTVDHPSHYGGADNPYESIKVIEAWQLDFCLGNTVKYISRAGKKDPAKLREDLEKALWYLQRRIDQLQ